MMGSSWTYGRKLSVGFGVVVLFAMAIGVMAIGALRDVVSAKDRVITIDAQLLIDAERLHAEREAKSSASRAFLLTGDEEFVKQMNTARSELSAVLARLTQRAYSDEGRAQIETIRSAERDHQLALDKVIALRRTTSDPAVVSKAFRDQVDPPRDRLNTAVLTFVDREERLLEAGRKAASDQASAAITRMVGVTAGALLVAALLAFLLTRTLSRQIGTTVGHVQSSSTELQAAANQQATASREQSTAMNEITTTISELLVTSRQIADGAQRVAQIAQDTASNARAGEHTVEDAKSAISAIQRQVERVVTHMLELGKKSQQIGAVVDIVSELAEQTNILAINATIEAAGAGDSGKRFAVVADEIRKLADRVAGSTKEIRVLIEDVRSSVNTTVMATETGAKAVDAGSKQFTEVASSFGRIASAVVTAMDAAREIELSTKQQASAVEQVNVAIANVAQASKETEASSSQTLLTASELAKLSDGLLRLVRPAAAA
jgi:methyl-accepting chemotaxis protein